MPSTPSARRPWLLAVLLAAAGAVAPTAAAQRGVDEPAPPVVVAAAGEVVLSAQDGYDGELCLGFGAGEQALLDACGDPAGVATLPLAGSEAADEVGVAVPAPAVRVEVRRAGQLLAGAATVPGAAYTGRFAGRVGFAVVPLPPRTPADGLRVRALDVAGRLVAVAVPNGSRPLERGRRPVLSGRSGPTRWSVDRFERSFAAPSVVDLEREVVQQCVQAAVTGLSRFRESECRPRTLEEQVLGPLVQERSRVPVAEDVCLPRHFRLVHGTAAPGTRSVALELGDGRRLAARTATEADGTVVYAAVVGAGQAVRGVRRTTAAGTRARQPLALAPVSLLCAGGGPARPHGGPDPTVSVPDLIDRAPLVRPTGPVTAVGAGPGFRVADGPDGSLCLAAGRAPLRLSGCRVVAPGGGRGEEVVDDSRRPTALVEALPAQVTAVRLGPVDGPLRTVATVEAPGYAGPYEGRVRFLAVAIASFRDAARRQDLDAAGRVLSETTAYSTPAGINGPQLGPSRRIAGSAGRLSLWRTTFRGGDGNPVCLTLTGGRAPTRATSCQFDEDSDRPVILSSSCATRRLTVGVARSEISGLRLRSTAGADLRVAVSGDAGLRTLPRGAGLAAFVLEQGRSPSRRLRVAVPSPLVQRGWSAQIALPAPRAALDPGSSCHEHLRRCLAHRLHDRFGRLTRWRAPSVAAPCVAIRAPVLAT